MDRLFFHAAGGGLCGQVLGRCTFFNHIGKEYWLICLEFK